MIDRRQVLLSGVALPMASASATMPPSGAAGPLRVYDLMPAFWHGEMATSIMRARQRCADIDG